MFRRPRRGALGLRGRIVGLVLFTTVATLAVAALTLLGPLESSLKKASKTTLETELKNYNVTGPFENLDLSKLNYLALGFCGPGVPQGSCLSPKSDRYKLYHQGVDVRTLVVRGLSDLQARVGAYEVSLLGDANLGGGNPTVFASAPPEQSPASGESYDDVSTALTLAMAGGHTSHRVFSFGTIDGTDFVRAAIPFSTWTSLVTSSGPQAPRKTYWAVAVRKRIDEIPAAVSAVGTAFLTAALAGLGLTLILGIPLSATLVRRLRQLRQAALRLALEGPGVRVPVDRARDEVGDLARSFATMQRQLKHQEEARRAFVATASHELRTPLASLDGMLELLDDDLRAGAPNLDEARALLERARAQSRRLGRLAVDLLDLSRLDAEVKLRSEPVELSELSRAVLAEFELGTGERGVTPVLETTAAQVWALGDPGSVARILRILLDNALRVSPDGGEIKVELLRGASAELSVSDQGPGIPPDEREVIFARFQRGRGTSGQAGFGLGLAIGRELAERMGGELWLDERYGPGAKFTLKLPVAHAPEVPALSLS